MSAAREVADAARAVLAEAEGALQEARAEVEANVKMEEAAANEVGAATDAGHHDSTPTRAGAFHLPRPLCTCTHAN